MDFLKDFTRKYLFPTLLILVGIILLASCDGQNWYFIAGSLAVFVVGVISMLYALDKIGKKIQNILLLVTLPLCLIFAYFNYNSIDSRIEYLAKKDVIQSQVIQRLKDVRTAELAYLDNYGVYTDNWDTLLHFLKTGKVEKITSYGNLPDTIPSEAEARKLGLIVKMPKGMSPEQIEKSGLIIRDTFFVSVLEDKYLNEFSLKKRNFPFELDSLPFAPGSGVRLELKTALVNLGGVTKPAFQCLDPKPFAPPRLQVGSIEDASTNGNWKEK